MQRNSTFSTARKSAIVAAIAFAAAGSAMAASAPGVTAGYPAGDWVGVEAQTSPTPVQVSAPVAQAETSPVLAQPTRQAAKTYSNTSTLRDTAPTVSAADTSASDMSGQTTVAVVTETTVYGTADGAQAASQDLGLSQPEAPAGILLVEERYAVIEVQPVVFEPAPITRESVRAELMAARENGTVTPANEIGDTPQVLVARDAYNQRQTDEIVAAYHAEYDRQIAMQEAEIRRAAIEADWVNYGVAQAPAGYDDPMAEVQIDVISVTPEALGE